MKTRGPWAMVEEYQHLSIELRERGQERGRTVWHHRRHEWMTLTTWPVSTGPNFIFRVSFMSHSNYCKDGISWLLPFLRGRPPQSTYFVTIKQSILPLSYRFIGSLYKVKIQYRLLMNLFFLHLEMFHCNILAIISWWFTNYSQLY